MCTMHAAARATPEPIPNRPSQNPGAYCPRSQASGEAAGEHNRLSIAVMRALGARPDGEYARG